MYLCLTHYSSLIKSPDTVELHVNSMIFFFFLTGGDAIDFCLAEKITPSALPPYQDINQFCI